MKTYVLGPNAARKLKGLFAGQGKTGSRKIGTPGVAFDSEYVAPFTVQWAQSANDGAGAWIIWLPSDSLLDVSGDRIDVSADLDPAGGDYPEGWFALTDDMIDASEGGVLYLNITRGDGESGEDTSAEFSNEDGYGENEGEDEDDGVISIAICQALVDSSDGSRNVKQFVTSTIVVGSMPTFMAGDTESSEWINTEGKRILIQGYPGNAGESEDVDHSGLTFTTVSEREDEDGGKIPAKIIVGVKDKLTSESWAAKTMIVPISGGGTKIVHFLGCDDVDLTQGGGGGGGGSSGVVGSEYIDVDQEEDEDDPNKTHDVVKAKIVTPDAVPAAEDARHALLTNDTNQLVRAVKTFLGSGTPSASKRVIVDGPNGKVSVVSADGSKKIDIDSADIPGECGGTLKVHELKFKDKDGNIQKYHGLFCADIDLTRNGKLIERTVVRPSADPGGQNVMIFYYTDGSSDTFSIANGLNGSPGSPGKDGDAPEIEMERQGSRVYVYVDGTLAATIQDGHTPTITASKSGKVTTIFADGQAIATINDGDADEGELTEMDVVTGVTFSLTGGKLVAHVTKKKIKAKFVSDVSAAGVKVAEVKDVEVVTSESYSTSSHQFTNTRRKITVLGDVAATGQTPFTATPLSSE